MLWRRLEKSRQFYLRRFRKLANILKKEENWTKGTMAINSQALSCYATQHDACCWCLVGAIQRVSGNESWKYWLPNAMSSMLYKTLTGNTIGPSAPDMIIKFNDNSKTTYKMVKDTIQETILGIEAGLYDDIICEFDKYRGMYKDMNKND
jgi:hypothetical protein